MVGLCCNCAIFCMSLCVYVCVCRCFLESLLVILTHPAIGSQPDIFAAVSDILMEFMTFPAGKNWYWYWRTAALMCMFTVPAVTCALCSVCLPLYEYVYLHLCYFVCAYSCPCCRSGFPGKQCRCDQYYDWAPLQAGGQWNHSLNGLHTVSYKQFLPCTCNTVVILWATLASPCYRLKRMCPIMRLLLFQWVCFVLPMTYGWLHCCRPSYSWLCAQELLKEGSKNCAPHHLGILLVYHLQVSEEISILPAIRQYCNVTGTLCWPAAKLIKFYLLSQRHPPSKLHPAPDCSVLPLLFQVMKALDDLKQLPTQNVEDLDEAKCLASLHTVYSMTLTPAGAVSF